MNIVSVLVGISIAGVAAPSLIRLSLAPVVAQAKAANFSIAESAAVAFSGNYEGSTDNDWSTSVPDNCSNPVSTSSNGIAWDITCWGGESDSKYYQEVTRSYRLASSAGGSPYTWNNPIPLNIGSHQCPPADEWGIVKRGFNETYGDTLGACVPQVAWSDDSYEASNASQWQYDLRGYADMKGYPTHPDFVEG